MRMTATRQLICNVPIRRAYPVNVRGLSNSAWPERQAPRPPCPAWQDALSTGHPVIDTEHRELIDLLATTYRALDHALVQSDRVHEALLALHVFARDHFAHEEEWLAHPGMDPDHRAMHLAAHATFLRNIEGMLDRKDGMPADVCAELMEYLSRWLVNHILRLDAQLAVHCRSLGLVDATAATPVETNG